MDAVGRLNPRRGRGDATAYVNARVFQLCTCKEKNKDEDMHVYRHRHMRKERNKDGDNPFASLSTTFSLFSPGFGTRKEKKREPQRPSILSQALIHSNETIRGIPPPRTF